MRAGDDLDLEDGTPLEGPDSITLYGIRRTRGGDSQSDSSTYARVRTQRHIYVGYPSLADFLPGSPQRQSWRECLGATSSISLIWLCRIDAWPNIRTDSAASRPRGGMMSPGPMSIMSQRTRGSHRSRAVARVRSPRRADRSRSVLAVERLLPALRRRVGSAIPAPRVSRLTWPAIFRGSRHRDVVGAPSGGRRGSRRRCGRESCLPRPRVSKLHSACHVEAPGRFNNGIERDPDRAAAARALSDPRA